MTIERLSFFGLGRLGLPLAALFARSGLPTVGIDVDAALVQQLRMGIVPPAEPGLDTLVTEATGSITYTSDPQAAADTDASIILVATPSDPSRPAYSSEYVENACVDLSRVLRARPKWRYHLITVSSTLWPGTISSRIVPLLEEQLGRRAGSDFGVAYVPEFAALGELVRGFERPPFLLIGSDDDAAGAHAAALHRRVAVSTTPVRFLASRDAEILKIALNVFCCMKISFANSLAQLGDRLGGVDLDAVAETLSLDPRVGTGLLRAGTPYGGACLPRDIDAYLHLAQSVDLDAPLARAAAEINAAQYDFIERDVLAGEPRCVALLGLSFKPGTSVTVASPAFEFARRLLKRSIRVIAFDPAAQAREAARAAFGPAMSLCETLGQTVAEADTILICNPEPSFARLAVDAPADRRIVDPWGCVLGSHPGLVRPGRVSNRTATDTSARVRSELG